MNYKLLMWFNNFKILINLEKRSVTRKKIKKNVKKKTIFSNFHLTLRVLKNKG